MARIEIAHLEKIYHSQAHSDGLRALDRVSFHVADQEFVCILGPSGCGKSTILNILSGLDTQYGGDIRVGDRPLNGGSHGVRMAYVFQEPRLLPWLTVVDNLRFALECEGIPRASWDAQVTRYLGLVGLAGFERAYPHQLSGGMQQRASIARSFAVEPDVLLMDEPFSGLDEITARRLRKELLSLWSATHKTILFVTHNCFEATFLADRILLMSSRPGRVYEEVPIDLPRPRDYDDPHLFTVNAGIVRNFLKTIGEE
jgi:NitT/TauT family transport system ATP-binding protein